MSTEFFIYFILLIICDITKSSSPSDDDLPPRGFGKYIVSVKSITKCPVINGPIDKEAFIDYNLQKIQINQTDEEISGYITIPKSYKCAMGKLTVEIERPGAALARYNKSSTNPCSDIIMGFPLQLYFNVGSACIFKKGNFSVGGLVINQWAHMMTGDNFMYVRARITVEYFSSLGMTYCNYVVADVKPYPKIRRKSKTYKKRPIL